MYLRIYKHLSLLSIWVSCIETTRPGEQLASGSNQDFASTNASAVTQKKESDSCGMMRGFIEIERIAECLKLPKTIVDQSRDLYKEVRSSKQLKFANNVIASACVYIAARLEKWGLSLSKTRKAGKCGQRPLSRCYGSIVKLLNVKLEPLYSDQLVHSLCSDLDLPIHVKRMTHHVVQQAEAMKIVPQCDRQGVVVAAIFMASQVSGDKRTQKDVENISGIAGEVIWEAYRLMYPHAPALIPVNVEQTASIASLPRI